jgi:hypothetical protein
MTVEPGPQHDRTLGRLPEGIVRVSKCPARSECCHLGARTLTTASSTSQPEYRFYPPLEVILVGPMLYLPSCLLVPWCQDEENVRKIVTRLLG